MRQRGNLDIHMITMDLFIYSLCIDNFTAEINVLANAMIRTII